MPFSTPSLQVGTAHFRVAKVHIELAQSFATRQAASGVQPLQLPPQSTSVSLPLSTPSVQLVGWQMPFEQLTMVAVSGRYTVLVGGAAARSRWYRRNRCRFRLD